MDVLATFILLSGVLDDLRSQKVHNKLIIALFCITLILTPILLGPSALVSALISFGLALMFSIPLVLIGVIGGGDMKLFAVFGLATNIPAVIGVGVYSLIWGALLGIIRAAMGGKLQELVLSTTQLLWIKKGSGQKQFKIPFTVAMFFGWLTHLTLVQMRMSPW